MIKGILLTLLLVPSIASALDLRLGLMQPSEPLYENVYDGVVDRNGNTVDDDGLVGRIELSQRFRVNETASINIFLMHMSLWRERDPHYGINALGVELEFNFKIIK